MHRFHSTYRPLKVVGVGVHVQSIAVQGVQILVAISLNWVTLDRAPDQFLALYPNMQGLETLCLAPKEQHPAIKLLHKIAEEKTQKMETNTFRKLLNEKYIYIRNEWTSKMCKDRSTYWLSWWWWELKRERD